MQKLFKIRLLALFVYFGLPTMQIANATEITILVTPDMVIMGADSKSNFVDLITHEETSSTVTKIYQSGQYYFSLAGIGKDPSTGFYPATNRS